MSTTEPALNSSLNDCFAHGERRLLHSEAIALLTVRLPSVVESEAVSIGSAVSRFVSSPVTANQAIPAHTNAAVDGFAFAHAAYVGGAIAPAPIAGRAAAGHPFRGSINESEVVRILTGAVLPDGLDTVAMQEDCQLGQDGTVTLPSGLKWGANVRRAGEDVAKGALLVDSGQCLRPQDLAALASAGCAEIKCFRRLRVGLVSSGDEVIRAGSGTLALGQVFDANQPMLQGLGTLAGCDVVDLGIWRDDPQEIRKRLSAAAAGLDVIITSGGASRGDEDHMAAVVAALGAVHFWQLAVKPGRPMMFGQIQRHDAQPCVIVGLPGNPVAVFVCFLMYVMPMLRRLGGGAWHEPRRFKLPTLFAFTGRKPGRREFWRGILIDTPQGLAVDKYARDGSGLISGLRVADGLIDISEVAGDVAVGDSVDFIPFSEFGILRA